MTDGPPDEPPLEIVDTTLTGLLLTALLALVILGVAFLYALVLEPWLGLPSLRDHPLWLASFVSGLSVLFLWTILVTGPSRFIRVFARPPQPRLPRTAMLKELERFGDESFPYELVTTEDHDLVVRYRLADERWRGVLFQGGLVEAYWLFLRLDEETGTAWLAEKRRGIRWDVGVGPGGVRAHVRFSIFYGIVMEEIQAEIALDPLAGFRKVAEIGYGLGQVKQPVIGLLVRNGWTVRYKILPWQVRRRV